MKVIRHDIMEQEHPRGTVRWPIAIAEVLETFRDTLPSPNVRLTFLSDTGPLRDLNLYRIGSEWVIAASRRKAPFTGADLFLHPCAEAALRVDGADVIGYIYRWRGSDGAIHHSWEHVPEILSLDRLRAEIRDRFRSDR